MTFSGSERVGANLKRWVPLVSILALWWSPAHAEEEEDSPASVVEVGHWLEVRGHFRGNGIFEPRNIELVEPARYDELIGTIEEFEPGEGRFVLLGVAVEIDQKTTFARLAPTDLEGERVKVEGYFDNGNRFSARKIRRRGEGLEEITGRVEAIRGNAAGGIEFRLMGFRIPVPAGMEVEHLGDVEDFATSESRIQAIVDRGKDEEDLFGKGIQVTDNLRVAGQMQTTVVFEDEFDLERRDPEDIRESLAAFKARLIYSTGGAFFSVLELNYRRLWREEEPEGTDNIRNKRIGDAYLYWLDPFGTGLDIQIGRVDYDDEREWLYDQFLDGPKLIWVRDGFRAEVSVTTTLSDGSGEDESATNSILYVSNNDPDRHLAAYLIHRDFDLPVPEERTHFGIRVFGEWLPDNESWLEIARMEGNVGATDTEGWGIDIGSTWEFGDHFALTAGYALGTGDRSSTTEDDTFRQTGLQDNNGKFAGVTSFRYYGELVDPELANLRVLTLGLGWLPRRRVSVDLVGHRYRQDSLSRRWVDSQIDRRPNGRNSDLGREVDLVVGWRAQPNWDLEVIAGWFQPGKAFDRVDDALFGKVQFRYRF